MGIDEKDMYLHKCAAPHKEKCSITRISDLGCKRATRCLQENHPYY